MDTSKQVVFIWALPVLTILAMLVRFFSIKKQHLPSSNVITSNLQLSDPSCSSSSSSSPLTWDVFLSFYGKDTRRNFTSHLYTALDQAGIRTFRDDHALEKGQEISSSLLDAIRNSNMFIVVISENYASSRWCLDELAEILSCNKTKNQVVPVFCYVDPSDVRYQKGSFGKALESHKKRYSGDMIVKWNSALSELAELSGHHLRKEANEDESDIIQKIVGDVARGTFATRSHHENLFGIEPAVEEIYQKLSMDSNDVRAIGICGMGGIGKTTIAKTFYKKNVNRFDISCFSEKVEQTSQGVSLLEQLLSDLRKKNFKVINVESKIRKLKQILHSKKALIVLDDLEQSNYSELLANLGNLFSAGSRIIITTRDANLLNKLKADMSEVDTYMVKTLGQIESLELFSYHAFRKPVPPQSFKKLSLSFVNHAGGLPLALKVLGSSLLNRTDESFWKGKLEKVRAIPVNDIQKILQLSYDELDDEKQKAIFLDIAFFFVGEDKDMATDVFKSCDFFPGEGIPNLVDRCLLTIDKYNRFQMHNLIQDMGRELGKTTRLFLRGNAWKKLQNPEEMKNIEGLILDSRTSTYGQMTTIKRMSNLRLLQIIGAPHIKGNFKNVFPNLRCIRWHSCPWTHIPSWFPPNLVCIDMPSSKFKILWKGPTPVKQLNSLSCLYLSGCRELKRLPEQLGDLKALRKIDARETSIKKLPDSITHLKELAELNLRFCEKLRELPEQLGEMKGLKELDVRYSGIEQLPDSITQLKELFMLDLFGCEKLRKIPEQIGNMEGLRKFRATYTAIEQLPDSFGGLINLESLELSECENLRILPNSIWKLKLLKTLDLLKCSKLERLPELDASDTGDAGKISSPDSVKNMKKLKDLQLSCNVRLCLPVILCFSSLEILTLIDEGQILSSANPFNFSELFNLRHLTLENCTSLGSSLPELPLSLERLIIRNHTSLEQLPDLSSLRKLNDLYIKGCSNLQSISLLPSRLQRLSVHECTSLQDVPDLSMLKDLQELLFIQCNKLKSISLKQSSLQVGQPLDPFEAHLPNKEVAEWFSYQSSGHTVSFVIPPSFGSNFLGLALWVVFTCKSSKMKWSHLVHYMTAVITNETEGITEDYLISLHLVVGETQSMVKCITGEKLSMKSGDKISTSAYLKVYGVEVEVKMCGVHMIPSTSS